MPTIHRSIAIDASPGQVMSVLTDPNRLPDYAAGVKNVDEIDEQEGVSGGSFRVTYSVGGIPFHLRFHIAAYEPDSRVLSNFQGGLSGSFDWRAVPIDSGTELSLQIDYTVPGGPLSGIANRIVVERMNERNALQMLSRLKELSEGEPAPQPT